jgi:hypothetical protein
MLHQSFAVGVENVGNELEPAARRKQQKKLCDGCCCWRTLVEELLHDSTLCSRGHDWIRECPREVLVALHQVREAGQIPFSGVRI